MESAFDTRYQYPSPAQVGDEGKQRANWKLLKRKSGNLQARELLL